YQTALAMQAKPAFINTFVRHRLMQSEQMKQLLAFFNLTRDKKHLEDLRSFMLKVDLLSKSETEKDLLAVKHFAEDLLAYRNFDNDGGSDGLDMVRHNLRMLKQNNLPDTRLIVCSMEGPYNYPDIDKLLAEPEFSGSEEARRALRVLEEKPLLHDILSQTVLHGSSLGGVQVLIGGEGIYDALSQCSIVLARYGTPGLATGTLGVLGPMRMSYGRTISIVRFLSGLLSELVADTMTE
ncbi:MAG: hypothetical protein HGA87_07695, partial [Desulfobulbaceae bacterium]|nr:hypothetical protein [Desulfobulbaceae bacterium]